MGNSDIRHSPASGADAEPDAQRNLRLNVGAAMAARVTNLVASLLIVPISVRVLTAAEYGVLSTLVSISIILGLADLGIANSLLNRLAAAEAGEDDRRFHKEASSALAVTSTAAFLAMLICLCIAAAGGARVVFGGPDSGALPPGSGYAALIVVGVVALRNPLSVTQIARRAQLQGWYNAAIDASASGLRLLCVYFAARLDAGLTWIVAGAFLPWLALDIVNFWSYRRAFPQRSPRLRSASSAIARQMVRPAFLFLLLQITTALFYSTGSLVVAHVLGLEQVQQFSVPNQMALAAISVLTAATGQLWPAIGHAVAAGRTDWARQLVRTAVVRTTAASSAMAITFIAFGQRFISVWTGGEVQPRAAIILGLACWIVLGSLAGLVSFVLNATHVIGLQVALSIPASICTIITGAAMTARFGPAGMPWATVICATTLVIIPSSVFATLRLRSIGTPAVAIPPTAGQAC